jgi:hypothetical protein
MLPDREIERRSKVLRVVTLTTSQRSQSFLSERFRNVGLMSIWMLGTKYLNTGSDSRINPKDDWT